MRSVSANLHRTGELAESDSARLDLEVLLSHVVQKSRSWLYTWPEQLLSEREQQQFDTLLARRIAGEPVAHLIGRREFWSLSLKVNRSTLIPRPDTELLVETALKLCPQAQLQALDLGTGSGAIALALASERPGWEITATDKFAEVVTLAEENRRSLNLNNMRVVHSDWFTHVPRQTFDLIVSNPPYIDAADPHLCQGDVRFEPRRALVAADHGLADIQLITQKSIEHLSPGGWLIVEHGWQQAADVRKLFAAAGLQQLASRKDYSGWERLTIGHLS